MINDLRSVAIFAEVAKLGSFRSAASSLGLSPPAVSYHVSQLEARLGTALIYRSTRKLSLTHEGETLFRHAQDMLESAQQGLTVATSKSSEPMGKLVITISTAMTRAPLTRQLAEFASRFKGIKLQIIYSDTRQDLVENGIDLAIRAGDMDDSNLKSRKLGSIRRKLVCTPDYLASRENPKDPRELKTWEWIKLSMLPDERILRKQKKVRRLQMFNHVTVDNVEAMTQFCLNGAGLATPPDYLVQQALELGELIEVLPDWKVDPIPVYAVWHGNVTPDSNIRRLLDFIK